MQKELSAASLKLQEKNTQVELTEPMNNNHVFASAEKTTSSNSVRQHGANKVLYVYCHRSLKTTTVGSPVFCTCIFQHLYFCSTFFAQCTFNFNFGIWEESTPWTYCEKNDTYTARHYLADVQTIYSPSCCSWPLSKRILHAREKDKKKRTAQNLKRREDQAACVLIRRVSSLG